MCGLNNTWMLSPHTPLAVDFVGADFAKPHVLMQTLDVDACDDVQDFLASKTTPGDGDFEN